MKFFDREGNETNSVENIPWRPSVYGILVEDGKVLTVRQSWTDKNQLPGGGVDLGEDLIDALRREFLEETGYKITDYTFFSSETLGYNTPKKQYCRLSIFFLVKGVQVAEPTDPGIVKVFFCDSATPEAYIWYVRNAIKKFNNLN